MGYIYCITNQVNQKKYVGLTIRSLSVRFKQHKSDRNKYPNIPLYKAFNKYGVENFSISLLEEVDNSMLSEREIYWIDKLGTFISKNGYNATLGGQGGHRIYDDNDKERIVELWESGMSISDVNNVTGIGENFISSVVQELPNFKEHTQEIITSRIRKTRGRRIKQYSLTGEFVKEYETASDARRELGLSSSTQIISCCQIPTYTCHGYLWRYAEDEPPEKNTHYGKRRRVDQYDTDMNYITTYSTITEAAEKCGTKPGAISDSCTHDNWKAGGYFWRYHDAEPKEVNLMRQETKIEVAEIIGEPYEA